MFTSEAIKAKTIIEVSPVIVMNKKRGSCSTRLFCTIIYLSGEKEKSNVAWRWGMFRYIIIRLIRTANMKWNLMIEVIRIVTVRDIKKGEELFINYNGTHNDSKPLWFKVDS